MSRFLVLVSTTLALALASPAALADAPSDQGPQARSHQLDLAAWKKKKSSSSSSSGKKPAQARPAPQRPAPNHAATPAQRPAVQQQPAVQQPAAQRPAVQQQPAAQRPTSSQQPAAQRPSPQRPSATPQARPTGPAAQHGQIQAQPQLGGTALAGARAGNAPAAAVQRHVARTPPTNIAGATREARQAVQGPHAQGQGQGQGQGQHARDKQASNHASAHQQRVARAHAQARHAQAARHRHHAQAHWAHRAYASRHHHNYHGWHWYNRAWWPRHAYYGNPWYHPYWSYGVFVYGPRPVVHTVYVADQPAPEAQEAPERKVDRNHKWAVGMRAGGYTSGYEHGPGFVDFGVGISGRYRASEALGFEVAWAHHDQTWTDTTDRWSEPLAASVQLFAWPWTRFNPYLSAGITWTDRSYRDSYEDRYGTHKVSEDHVIFGPHGGLGLELGLGDNASVNVEGRLVGYLNIEEEDRAVPSAVQTTAGFNLYF